jgi:cytochrome c peroxidase
MSIFRLSFIFPLGLATVFALSHNSVAQAPLWSDDELNQIASLSLSALEPMPTDPSNKVADDPRAIELGRAFFSETGFSADGKVSCASCHQANRQFQDDQPLGHGVGTTGRRTMPLAGLAYSPFLFWDGRKDSLWSQALGPMESPVEHGGDRTMYAHLIAKAYRAPYEALFGRLPELDHLPRRAGPVVDPAVAAEWAKMSEQDRQAVSQVFSNIGKAIAAFERTITPPETRFDAYVAKLATGTGGNLLNEDEISGLRLFIGEGQCTTCHNGPLLSDTHFHNTGVAAAAGGTADQGRAAGAVLLRDDPFNCLGAFSDANPDQCNELRFMTIGGPDEAGAFKTPSLRGASTRAPYMHAGQITTMDAVIRHYRAAPAAQVGHSELRPLELSEAEMRQITAFLATLEPVHPSAP